MVEAPTGSPPQPVQDGTRPRPARRLPSGAIAVVLVVAGLALVGWGLRTSPAESTTPGVALPSAAQAATPLDPGASAQPPVTEPETTLEPRSAPAEPHPAAGVPNRVIVPVLGIDAPVVGIPVVDGILTPPADPQTLGWWQDGAAPGDVLGGALVTGHTVSVGGGALDDLEQIETGDRIRVETDAGQISYDVVDIDIYRKASLAQSAAEVFSQETPGRLVLITCEDWDGQQYLSNVVVVAHPRLPVT